MSVFLPTAIAIAAALFLLLRRGPDLGRPVDSLSPADREFLANELEPLTRLPLNTQADEDAWHCTTRELMERLGARFGDVAAVLPHELYHYLDDADIHRKEPSCRVSREKRILEFIRELREQTQDADGSGL